MPPTGANTKVKDPEYCNWLKVGLGLYYLKVGLSSFIQGEMSAMHKFLIQKLYNGSPVPATLCSSCNAKDVKQNRNSYTWKFRTPCPQRLCDTWLTELLALHTNPTSNKLYCENCNVTAWPHASWECAKLYMPRGQTGANTGPAHSDSQALLTLMANCKYFHSKLSQGGVQLTHTVSTIRNKVMHSGDMKLSDSDRKSFIQDIINLLEDPCHLKSLEECKQAVAEINKINNDSLDVFFNIDLEMKALRECVKDCRQELGVHKVETDKTAESLKKTEKTVDSLKEELKDLKVQFDNFEKETKDKVGDIDTKCQKMGTRFKKLSRTLTSKNAAIKREVDSLKRKAVTDQNIQNKKFRKLDQAVQQIKGSTSQASTATADKFGDLDTKYKKMGTKVTKLSRTVENVQRQVRTQNKVSSLIKKAQRKVVTDLNQQRMKVRKLDQEMRLRKGSTSQEDVRDIQQWFIKAFESVQIILMNPVFDNAIDWKDLEDFYTDIVIDEEKEESAGRMKDGHGTYIRHPLYISGVHQVDKKLTSFRQIFEKDGKKVKRIILKAPAGQGKSTFCRKLVHTWCSVQKKKLNIVSDDGMSNKTETSGLKDEDEMLKFDVLLYICLRDISDEKTLMDTVNTKFPLDESHNCHIETLIRQAGENKVLLILDGLDEMDNSPAFIKTIMQKSLYPHLTVLATTRPWKIGQLGLIRSAHIDLLLDLQGFSYENSMLFAKRIFDKYYKDESAIAQFQCDIMKNSVIRSLIHVPLLLLFIIHVWYEQKSFPQTIHELYLEMLNVMVRRYKESKERKEKSNERQDDKKYLLSKTWPLESMTFIITPTLRKLSLVKHFGEEFLAALSEVANYFLVTAHGETSLVLDEEALLDLLGKDGTSKLQTALDLGIISKSESPGTFRKRICLTFLHKTVQEFFAAINICCREDRCNIFLDSLHTLDDVFKNEQIIKFAAGISTTQCLKIFEKIYEVCDKDRGVLSGQFRMYALSRLYIDCIREACGETLNLKLYCIYADQDDWNVLQSALRNTVPVRIHLKYLCLKCCILDDATLNLLEFKCLTMLQLENMSIMGKLLLSKCTELKVLELNECTLDDNVLDLSEYDCLEYIELVHVTMKGKLLLSKCNHLKYLKLNDCTLDDNVLDLSEHDYLEYIRLKDVTMKGKLLLSKCNHLKYLQLNHCRLADATLDLLESKCLEYLSLKYLTMKVRLLLSKCTQLKYVELASCILEVAVFDLSKCTYLKEFLCNKVIMTGKGRLLCTQPQMLTLVDCNLGEFTLDLSVSTCLIKQIPQLQNTSMQNADLDDALCSIDNVNNLYDLTLHNVTMSKECKEVFFNSLSQCKNLCTLSIKNVDLCDALLSINSVNNFDELDLDNVTMSKECKEVFFNSLSQCKQLKRLSIKSVNQHENVTMGNDSDRLLFESLSKCKLLMYLSIENMDLDDALLSFSSCTLHQFELDNVTLSFTSKMMLFVILSQFHSLRSLSLKNLDLSDGRHDLYNMKSMTDITIENVKMDTVSKVLMCTSLSQCKQLWNLSLKDLDLCDGILSLNNLEILDSLTIDNVTMCKDGYVMLCGGISACKTLTSLSLKDLDLYTSTLSLNNLERLYSLTIDNVTMCKDGYVMLCNYISMRKYMTLSLKNLDLGDAILSLDKLKEFELVNIKMTANSCDKCVVNNTKKRDDHDDYDYFDDDDYDVFDYSLLTTGL